VDFHVAITSTGRGVQRYRLKGIVERIVEEKTVAVGSYPKTVTAVDFQYGNVISYLIRFVLGVDFEVGSVIPV
jgi:hypothetical protein